MPTIDPSLVPTINPGSLFSRFTTDASINVRWFTATDPVTSTVLNRPIADLALRQLILAKTVDALNLRLSHQALFPFLTQPQVSTGTQNVDVPPSWIWDMQVSLPRKWEKVRLAKARRLSGTNDDSNNDSYTGLIRLIFTALEEGSTTEVAVFTADYQINSDLTYQIVRINTPSSVTEPIVIPAGETETVDGFLTFRTLDPTDSNVQSFYNVVAPPLDTTTDSSGLFISPDTVEINDSLPGGASVTGDYDFTAVSHGTGLLTLSAWNPIPPVDSTITTWISTFNYPYDSEATLIASNATGVTIPSGLFKEFNLVAPAGDEPTDDVSGEFFPVYVSRIERLDTSSDSIKFYFSTFNVESPSIVPIEFATLTLERSMGPGKVVPIIPENDLYPNQSGDNWHQGFGKGHVALSDLWTSTGDTIDNFFDLFIPIIDEPPQAIFTKESTRVSSFGLSRVPATTPTAGQSAALRGTVNTEPSSTNRYVVEADQGLGTQVDFATNTTLPADRRSNPDIERFGYSGALCHRAVYLVVNTDGEDHSYDEDILPRLRILLGRDPIFHDVWFDGTVFKTYTGSSWLG